MKGLTRVGLVLGGYVGACLIAIGVLYVYQQITNSAAAAQASAGMYAFGDLALFLFVFVALALIPTGLAVYFLIRKFLGHSNAPL